MYVEIHSLVPAGNFGEVYVGQLSVPKDTEVILRTVAIKTIKGKLPTKSIFIDSVILRIGVK